MSFRINRADDKFHTNYELGKKIDPISVLPEELVLNVLSCLNLCQLGTVCLVSKQWKQLSSEPILWKNAVYQDIAFSSPKWARCFGEDIVKEEDRQEEFSSLPMNIAEILKSPGPAFPGKRVIDTHMLVRLPKTLNGELSLNSLGNLTKLYFPENSQGYLEADPIILEELGDRPINKSYWVLMTKGILPGSKNKYYDEQQKIVANLLGYEIPETLECTACILSQYFDSRVRLFSGYNLQDIINDEGLIHCSDIFDYEQTYTRCKDVVHDYLQVVVGRFSPSGLILQNDYYHSQFMGIAALRRFNS